MKKKSIITLITYSIAAVIISSFRVSAQFDLSQGVSQVGRWIEEFGYTLFGSGGFLFEKFLFLFLLLAVISLILGRIPLFSRNGPARIIITLAVSLLGTRYLVDSLLAYAVLLPYNVMGVVILSLIPLVIFFYFIEYTMYSAMMRRISWIVFSAIFIGLAITKSDEIGNLAWIYAGTALISGILMLFDESITRHIAAANVNRSLAPQYARQIADLRREVAEDSSRLDVQGLGKENRILLRDRITNNLRRIAELEKKMRG